MVSQSTSSSEAVPTEWAFNPVALVGTRVEMLLSVINPLLMKEGGGEGQREAGEINLFEAVPALEKAVAVITVQMVVVFVLDALLLRRIRIVATRTYEGPVAGGIHVLLPCLVAVEPSGARVTFVYGFSMARCVKVVLPGLPASREGLAASATLKVVEAAHGV